MRIAAIRTGAGRLIVHSPSAPEKSNASPLRRFISRPRSQASAFAVDVHRQKDVVAAVLGSELAQSADSAGKNVCAREKPLSNRRAWYAVAQRLDSHDAARFQVTQGIAPSATMATREWRS